MSSSSFDASSFSSAFSAQMKKIPSQVVDYLSFSNTSTNVQCLFGRIGDGLKNAVLNVQHMNDFEKEKLRSLDTALKYLQSFNFSFKDVFVKIFSSLERQKKGFEKLKGKGEENRKITDFFSSLSEKFGQNIQSLEENLNALKGELINLQTFSSSYKEFQDNFSENLREMWDRISCIYKERITARGEFKEIETKFNQIISIMRQLDSYITSLKENFDKKKKKKVNVFDEEPNPGVDIETLSKNLDPATCAYFKKKKDKIWFIK